MDSRSRLPLEPEQTTRRLEEEVTRRARSFDIPALLGVLRQRLGYQEGEIEYDSHPSLAHQGNLIHAVAFHREAAHKRVVITVNLGLRSANSPLPFYFFKLLEELDSPALGNLLAFLDHYLLRDCFVMLQPERAPALVTDWPRTLRSLVRLLRPESPSGLHWIFQRVFPELETTVRRTGQRENLHTAGVRLGMYSLGSGSALGGVASVPARGLDVTLYCASPRDGTGVPWIKEVPRRLAEQVLPLVEGLELCFTVSLVLRERKSWLRLAENHFLGHDSLYDPFDDGSEQVRKIILEAGLEVSSAGMALPGRGDW